MLQVSVIWAQSLGVPVVMDLGRVCDTEHAKMLCVCQWVCVCCVRGGRYGLYSIQWNAFNVGLAYTIQYFWKGAAKKLFQSMKGQSPSLVAVFASPINCCCTLWWTSTPQYMYLLQSSYSKEPEIANRSLPTDPCPELSLFQLSVIWSLPTMGLDWNLVIWEIHLLCDSVMSD